MSDPLRTDSPRALDAATDADRDAKIEQLLVLGLDQYFAGYYEQAINVWTRALFLDRSHARARAYIERARSALAERQRQTDELLHTGIAAFERGEGAEARRLLESAIGRGAPVDEAQAVLDRLDRLEQGVAPTRPESAAPLRSRRPRVAVPVVASRRGARTLFVLLIVAGAAAYGVYAWRRSAASPFTATASGVLDMLSLLDRTGRVTPAPVPIDTSLGLPRRGETTLARARTLQASGRLRDALATLDAVRLTDPERADADRLRGELQRQLLSVSSPAGAGRVP